MSITKGKWEVEFRDKLRAIGRPESLEIMAGDHCVVCMTEEDETFAGLTHEDVANAKLMAEAGTVYNETGYTPRQLAEQKADLLAACEMAEQCTHPGGIEGMSINEAAILVRDTLKAAIAKAKGE